jgi:hypothetical protein
MRVKWADMSDGDSSVISASSIQALSTTIVSFWEGQSYGALSGLVTVKSDCVYPTNEGHGQHVGRVDGDANYK